MWFAMKRLSLGLLLIVAGSAVLLLSDVRPTEADGKSLPRIAILQQASTPVLDEGIRGMLDAHKDFEQFRGCTAQEFFAWLQCSLRHNFSNFVRAYRRYAKREVKREEPLRVASCQARGRQDRFALECPSEAVIRRESSERYRRALEQMPEDIGELMRLRFDARLTFPEIGGRLGMTPEGARKLLTRTLRLLGEELDD